jgi:hypothetical protein
VVGARSGFLGGRALELGAVPITAGVVGDERVRTVLAARNVAAENWLSLNGG